MTAQSKKPEATARGEMSSAAPITRQRLEAAIVYVAQCVVAQGPAFGPFLDKLERELAVMQAEGDPLSRAHAILAAAAAKAKLEG